MTSINLTLLPAFIESEKRHPKKKIALIKLRHRLIIRNQALTSSNDDFYKPPFNKNKKGEK